MIATPWQFKAATDAAEPKSTALCNNRQQQIKHGHKIKLTTLQNC